MKDTQKDQEQKRNITQRLAERAARTKQERVEQIKRVTERWKEHTAREARTMRNNISEKTDALLRQKQMQAPTPEPAPQKGMER